MNLFKRISYKNSAQVTRNKICKTNVRGSNERNEMETRMQVWENFG